MALSFGWNSNKSSADWGGSVSNENRGRASFDQIGFVWSTKIGNKTNLRYVNFGFNYHKRANFNRQFSAKGNLNGLSLTNQMAGMLLNAGDESESDYSTNSDFEALLNASNPYVSGYNGFWGASGTPILGAMGARTGLVDANGIRKEILVMGIFSDGMENMADIIVVKKEVLMNTISIFHLICSTVFILGRQ